MITLAQIQTLIETAPVDDPKLKEMVVGYVKLAYDIGFYDGVNHAVEIQKQISKNLFPI